MIPLTGTSGFFTRIGKLYGQLLAMETIQNSTLPTFQSDIQAQYTTDLSDINSIITDFSSITSNINSFKTQLNSYATSTLTTMVSLDVKLANYNTNTCLSELISQMKLSSNTINSSIVSAGSITTSNGNSTMLGNGTLLYNMKNSSGQNIPYVFQENLTINCTADSQPGTGGTQVNGEQFLVSGDQQIGSYIDNTWIQGGSGTTLSLSPLNPDSSNGASNYLTNSNMETWSGTPAFLTNWNIGVGTAGTTIVQSTNYYRGAYALGFVGNGTELTSINQVISYAIVPNQSYLLTARIKYSGTTPTNGVLIIGTSFGNITVNATSLTTSYQLFSAVITSPQVLPSSELMSISLTTALTSGCTILIDDVIMGEFTLLPSGIGIAIIPGNNKFIYGDTFTLPFTNTPGQLMEAMWRFFQLDLTSTIIPNSTTPTIPDSLVST